MQRSSYAPIARQLREAQWICRQCAAKHSRHASSVAVLSTQSSSRSRRQIFSSPSAQTNSAIVQQRRWIGRNYLKNIVAAEKDWQERSKQIENGDRKNILEVLEERGFVNQIVGSREQLQKLLQYRRVGVYCGVDPTAPSLHVGHMVPFMALSWMYIHGYPSTFLLGGATSRIGDPEGRLTAREQVGRQTRSANMALMHNQLKRFGPLMENYAKRRGYEREWAWRRALLNNAEWHSTLPWGTLIREMGQYVRLGPMLGRDSVKNRMTHGDGMSFAEFTYPLIQAWDWWEMFQKGVQIQIGGADQFGNILQGAEAVKSAAKNKVEWLEKVELEMKNTQELDKPDLSEEPMGFTVPLLTTANGEKFGKSAGNAVWLDASMTSVFELYAFWLKTADADVEKYLKLFTFLPLEEISTIMTEHQQDESKRVAQHKLAHEFTELVHGLGAAEECVKQHRALFDSKNMSLDEIIAMATKQQPTTESAIDGHPAVTKNAKPQSLEKYSTVQGELPRGAVIGKPLSHVLWSAGLAASKTEAQKLINNKGAYIGAQSTGKGTMNDSLSYSAIQSSAWTWWKDFIIDDHLLILRTGKWRVKIINLINDQDFVAKGLICPGWGEAPSTPLEGAAPQSVPAARSSIPHIESEADTVDSHGWDSMTRLKMNKETKKLLADEHAAMRRRTHDEGRSVLAPEKEYIPIGGVLARSPTYTRPPKRQL